MSDNGALKALDSLFTMCFDIDESLLVSRPSAALRRYFPSTADHKPLLELFQVRRPELLQEEINLASNLEKLFLLIAKDDSIALRGQLIRREESGTFRFFGAPWLAWMSEYQPDTSLSLHDFPIFDTQMDQRFHVATKDLMVRDLEKLTLELTEARDIADEANRLKSDLFAVMSHEMRTPLHGVVSSLSLLQQSDSEPERKQLADVAQKSATGLLHVINYALDYSKIDAGRMKLEPIEFGIVDLVRNVADMTTGKAQHKGVELITNVDPKVSTYFKGDEEKIRQVLINLTSNAIKFTDQGKVSLDIGLSHPADLAKNADHLEVEFSVTDTGCGIAEEDLKHVFEPFWSKKRNASGDAGTGLGLKISQQIVELMGSEIFVRSKPGEGSVFSFRLSLDPVSDPSVRTLRRDSKTLPSFFTGKVMIVDDNETNLMLTEMILKNLGLEVCAAKSGQEAIDLAKAIPFDLILMDITMPGMDGVEATRQIRQLMLKPPVIALTAHAQTDMIDEYLSNGFKGYLRKPLEHMELIRELNLWLPAGKGTAPLEIEESSLPVVNQKTLETLNEQIGEDNFIRVRKLYIDETRKRLANLLAAWVRRDHEALTLEAHTLASSVSSFGCEDLAWRLRNIEKANRAEDLSVVISYIKDIEKNANQSLEEVGGYTFRSSPGLTVQRN